MSQVNVMHRRKLLVAAALFAAACGTASTSPVDGGAASAVAV